MVESKNQKEVGSISDDGCQSDSSFEAKQPQALAKGTWRTSIGDAHSSNGTFEERKDQMDAALDTAQSDISAQVIETDFQQGLIDLKTMDDSKSSKDHMIMIDLLKKENQALKARVFKVEQRELDNQKQTDLCSDKSQL